MGEDGKTVVEIKNKLKVGDNLEIIVPHQIEAVSFTIEKLWNVETKEEIEQINPGKAEQKVILQLPIPVETGWIIRRKK